MKAINIQWDVSDNDLTKKEQKALLKSLPTEIEIPDNILEDEDEDDYEDIISDYISDETGFCHYGFELEE